MVDLHGKLVNVGKYTIHGSFGYSLPLLRKFYFAHSFGHVFVFGLGKCIKKKRGVSRPLTCIQERQDMTKHIKSIPKTHFLTGDIQGILGAQG